MNYVPYPRLDLDTHVSLTAWRAIAVKSGNIWTSLKPYLAENCRVRVGVNMVPKCWYTELHQGDNYALDVEHFRGKNSAMPFNAKMLKAIEKDLGFPLLQDKDTTGAYNWLEYDYRNYRLVTATPNRGGAKHIYFPIFDNTQRLIAGSFPWTSREYPILLDPADLHDASLLIVLPDGRIAPKTPKTQLTSADIAALPNSWQTAPFNYTRAVATIHTYRLNDNIFKTGRSEVYENVADELETLLMSINTKDADLIKKILEKITKYLLPSAQFSLAARCSVINYEPDAKFDPATVTLFRKIIASMLSKLKAELDSYTPDWTKP